LGRSNSGNKYRYSKHTGQPQDWAQAGWNGHDVEAFIKQEKAAALAAEKRPARQLAAAPAKQD
jgi:hypothetical protein